MYLVVSHFILQKLKDSKYFVIYFGNNLFYFVELRKDSWYLFLFFLQDDHQIYVSDDEKKSSWILLNISIWKQIDFISR